MRFSELSLGRRLLGIVLFILVMSGVAWLARMAAYDWIPESVIGYVAVGMVAGAVGWLAGERSARRHVARFRDGDFEGAADEWRE